MSFKLKLQEYLRDNPAVTNEEIAEYFNKSIGNIKTTLSKLKRCEAISIDEIDSQRVITVNTQQLYAERKEENEEKIWRLENLLDKYDYILENDRMSVNQLLNFGKIYINIIDRLWG